MAAWIKMSLGMEMGLSPCDFVLDGDPASPLPKKGAEPLKFSAHVSCGQTVGWNKMVLGMELGLIPEDFVSDGDPVPPPQKGAEPPNFWPMFILDGCIKMPFGMEVGVSPGDFVSDADPAPSQKVGGAPNFRPMSIVAKRLDGSRWHLA